MHSGRPISRVPRSPPVRLKGELRTHLPFQEFSIKSTDELVALLEKSKPSGATIEVSPMEETHHSPCMQEMQAIVVQSVDLEGKPVQTFFMYQYCPTCKIGVRVL